jgi:lipopolysaccharide export system protein LptA
MRTIVLPLVAAALAAAAPPAAAERADREKEIVVGADRLVADDANRTSTFQGSVVITQGTMRMTADKVTVKEDAERHKVYVANGSPVTFRQKRDKVEEYVDGMAERAEFDDRNDVLRLYTRARVKSNQNEITGDFISYDMKREVAEVSGAPPGKAAPQGSRVKVIILPPRKGPEAEKAEKNPPLTLRPEAGTQ